jgi:restriction endonuclease S subunit
MDIINPKAKSIFNRSVNRSSIHKTALKAVEVPLTPPPEQKRIIQTTTELKKALMHKRCTESHRHEPQKQTEIGPVPESWEVTTVGDVATVKGGKRLSKGDKLVECVGFYF